MNPETVWLTLKIYARCAEAVYKMIHTTNHAVGESEFTVKVPISTLKHNLYLMKEITDQFRVSAILPKWHHPVFMTALADPIDELCCYLEGCPILMSLKQIQRDRQLIILAEKITRILHEVYPTEGPVGLLVDLDTFSFQEERAEKVITSLNKKRRQLEQAVQAAGEKVLRAAQYMDDLIEHSVQPKFTAPWFKLDPKFYLNGPMLVYIPKMVEKNVVKGGTTVLEPTDEKRLNCTLTPAASLPTDSTLQNISNMSELLPFDSEILANATDILHEAIASPNSDNHLL